MHLTPRSVLTRAQGAVCVLAITVGLTTAPAMVTIAEAGTAATSPCASAQAAVAHAQQDRAAAQRKVVAAKKALARAKKAEVKKAAKVKKAKKVLTRANHGYASASKAVKIRQAEARSACANPAPNPQAASTGKKLSLLALGNGLPVGDIDATQLVALLDELLPGVAGQLNPAELASLLSGFNTGDALDPADALALLTGVLDPAAVTALLGGQADPEAVTALLDDIIGQLGGLGGLPVPSEFDPAGLWDTFAGIFGTLGADQLGSLLALVTGALGGGGADLDLGQLTDLIDSLVPGISDQFDPDQLTAMLAGLNGTGPGADVLADLLGGQFTPTQLQQILSGTAGDELLGAVVAQVMAQLGTAGGGGLELPGDLDAGSLAALISTVTDLITSVLGGGGLLPVVCGLIPIPLLCP
ncbi:MAG: hypothetical protein NTV23_09660 [Propionibacteriales bacterium]|nr:hypothetical protein [Propionibacteriales bacterium]